MTAGDRQAFLDEACKNRKNIGDWVPMVAATRSDRPFAHLMGVSPLWIRQSCRAGFRKAFASICPGGVMGELQEWNCGRGFGNSVVAAATEGTCTPQTSPVWAPSCLSLLISFSMTLADLLNVVHGEQPTPSRGASNACYAFRTSGECRSALRRGPGKPAGRPLRIHTIAHHGDKFTRTYRVASP